MTSINIVFLIVVSLVAYSLVATYLFWLMRHDLRYHEQRLSTAKSEISKLETAYETLRLIVERTGKNQAEALSIIAEANNRIDRLEDKRKVYQSPKATPRPPRPLRGKPAKQQPYDRDSMLLTAGENER